MPETSSRAHFGHRLIDWVFTKIADHVWFVTAVPIVGVAYRFWDSILEILAVPRTTPAGTAGIPVALTALGFYLFGKIRTPAQERVRKRYTRDAYWGVEWHWAWSGELPVKIRPHCPMCQLALIDAKGSRYFLCLECAWGKSLANHENIFGTIGVNIGNFITRNFEEKTWQESERRLIETAESAFKERSASAAANS